MIRAWFPGVFGRSQSGQESDTGKEKEEDLMMMDPTYQALQRVEAELEQYKIALGQRDVLLTQAYDEITAGKTQLDKWDAALKESYILLTAAYEEIAQKDKAIRELKARVSAVGQKAADVGSPGEPPARPPARVRVVADQEPAHETEPTDLPPLPQRVADEEVAEGPVGWDPTG